MFSSRVQSRATKNRLAQVKTYLDTRGIAVIDLMESNPTRVGFEYPTQFVDAFADDVDLG